MWLFQNFLTLNGHARAGFGNKHYFEYRNAVYPDRGRTLKCTFHDTVTLPVMHYTKLSQMHLKPKQFPPNHSYPPEVEEF